MTDAQLGGVRQQPPLVRSAPDDQQSRGRGPGRPDDAFLDQRERADDVLMALLPHQTSG